ncbi:NUMOD4 domain-containing protein [Cytobacillus horneckiae]|uniref:NUMOD4 domain-containing protein n=1 Tax=Cytobacillus horneckiae TaxID=549687 RepID=UPI003D9A9E94
MLFLYDPTTNISTETTYEYLMELTGKKNINLRSIKSRGLKINNLNCYLADEKTTVAQRKAWYEKEKFHNEVWKAITGSDDKFLVSSYGRIKRVYKNHTAFLLPFLHKKSKQLHVKVKFEGKYAGYKVSKLVAFHFIGKPKLGEVVHHKNLVITDNYFGNLEYITRNQLGKKTGFKSKSKPVIQLDRDTLEPINEFRSAREAGRKCYLSYQAVLDNCNRKSKSSGGFIFMFTEDYEQTVAN